MTHDRNAMLRDAEHYSKWLARRLRELHLEDGRRDWEQAAAFIESLRRLIIRHQRAAYVSRRRQAKVEAIKARRAA